jgi:hypothetical protein
MVLTLAQQLLADFSYWRQAVVAVRGMLVVLDSAASGTTWYQGSGPSRNREMMVFIKTGSKNEDGIISGQTWCKRNIQDSIDSFCSNQVVCIREQDAIKSRSLIREQEAIKCESLIRASTKHVRLTFRQ